MVKTRKKKRRRLNLKRVFIVLIIITIFFLLINYILNIPIKHIKIIGTKYTTDNEIINIANIKNYPPIFKTSTNKLITNIDSLPLISETKISKSIIGTLTIKVTEDKILFYNRSKNKVITSSRNEIDNSSKFLGVPTLINYVPDTIYNDFINGLNKIDESIISLISEIEYSPSKSTEGAMIDEYRFKLSMNDGNTVYINTLNIEKLNKYIEICSTKIASMGIDTKGSFYLDSATTNYTFEKYKEEQVEVPSEN